MPDILYKWYSYVYSFHFIIISTRYLNAAGFLDGFLSSCNITDLVYRRWVGGRGMGWEMGWVGSHWRVKAPVQTQKIVLCLQYVTQAGAIQAKTAVRSSFVPHSILLMPFRAMKCILVV